MKGGATIDRVGLLVAVLLAAGTFVAGHASLGRIRTGEYSEQVSLIEARRMVAGDHRFGIVEYTHYPNGPIYLVAAMLAAGVEPRAMRLLPLATSSLCLGLLGFALWTRASGPGLRIWAVVACGVLVLQPAFVLWQGALHEHSYALSLALLAIALAVLLPARAGGWLLPVGFVAGWTGYDWLPGQALLVLGARWLALARQQGTPLSHAAALALLDALRFTAGAALAVLAHLVQLALFFGDLESAARDLLGSAAMRAGSEAASQMNPEYSARIDAAARDLQQAYERLPGFQARFGADFDVRNPSRWGLPVVLVRLFLEPRWSAPWLLAATGGVGLALAWRQLLRSTPGREALRRALAVAAAGGLVAGAAGVTWVLLMPQHAANHMHMLPRHVLMSGALLLALPVLLTPTAGAGDPLEGGVRELARPFLFHALVPLLTVGVYLHAVWALG